MSNHNKIRFTLETGRQYSSNRAETSKYDGRKKEEREITPQEHVKRERNLGVDERCNGGGIAEE